jgi:hypothetical protein
VSARLDDRARQPASPRRKFVIVMLLASPIVVALFAYVVVAYGAGGRLQDAVATADRLDSGWRLGQLIDRRSKPDPDANSADVVVAMAFAPLRIRESTTPADETAAVPRGPKLEVALNDLASPNRLPTDVAAGLADEVELRADAIAVGRNLVGMGEGHHKITYAPFVLNTLLPHAQTARDMARLLQKDAILRADRGDVDGAVESSRAALGVARSMGDEPFVISQLVRMACENLALNAFDRALSQGEASADEITRIQAEFARDERQPLLLYAMRGERATLFDVLDRLATGEASAAQLGPAIGAAGTPAVALSFAHQFGAYSRYSQAVALERCNEAVEIAKRPLPEQHALWESLKARNQSLGPVSKFLTALVVMLGPFGENAANAYQRTRASFRVAQAMAACERYRLANGRWPGRLDDLAPDYLTAPLVDPYDGKPLRMTRTNDGLVIYAVGQDLHDNGGKLHPQNAPLPGFDVGFRLWDIDQRHRPIEKVAP